MMVWAFFDLYIYFPWRRRSSFNPVIFFLPSIYITFDFFLSLKLPFAFVYYIPLSFFEEFFMQRSPYVYCQ